MNELKEPFVIHNAREHNAPELKPGYELELTLSGPEALILEEALNDIIQRHIFNVERYTKVGCPNDANILAQKTEILITICSNLSKRRCEKNGNN